MRIHRLIFRYDFTKNIPGVIDGSGEIIEKFLEPACDQHKGEMGADFLRRVTSMSVLEEDKSYLGFTMEPRAIVGELETVVGIEFRKLSANVHFSLLTRLADQIMDHCKATAIQRFGFRAFVLGEGGNNFAKNLVTMRQSISSPWVRAIEENLGDLADIAFSFDGGNADKAKYHARVGPYSQSEAGKYFLKLAEAMKAKESNSWVSDLDIYDENFKRTVSTAKLCESPLGKIQRVATMFDGALAGGEITEAN
jgi:hypothetical protein